MNYTIDNPKLVKYYGIAGSVVFTGVVKDINGTIAYYEDGVYHRSDGPSIVSQNGNKHWHIHGALHREDGPAVEYSFGGKEWWYNGKCYGEDDVFTTESWTKKWQLEIFK